MSRRSQFRAALHCALLSQRAHLKQSLINLIAISLGVALVAAFQLMNRVVVKSFTESVDSLAGRADLIVTSDAGAPFPESILQSVASVNGVALAVPLIRAVAFNDDGSNDMLTVFGIDLANDSAVRLYDTHDAKDEVVDDLVAFLNSPRAVILAAEYASRRHISIGDKVNLATTSGVQSFSVEGLLRSEGIAKTLGGRFVVMDLFAAQRAFASEEHLNEIDILVDPSNDPVLVQSSVAQLLGEGYRVEAPSLRTAVVKQGIEAFTTLVTAFSALAVLAGFIICYSRLASTLQSRSRQIAVLRAVGVRQRSLFLQYVFESALLGICGTVAGLFLGTLISVFALPWLTSTAAIAFRMPVPAVHPSIELRGLLVASIAGLAASVAAAFAPALRAAHVNPSAALGRRDAETSPTRSWPWAPPAILALFAIGLILVQLMIRKAEVGLITTALIGIGIALSARPLVASSYMFLGRGLGICFGSLGRFAATYFREQAQRVSFSISTLGLGLAVVLMFGLLGWSFEQTLAHILRTSLMADVVVASRFVSGGYWTAPLQEELAARVATIEGVRTVAAEQNLEIGYQDGRTLIKAFDTAAFRDDEIYAWPLDTSMSSALNDVAAGRGVFITRAFAYRYGAGPNDTLRLLSPSGPVEFSVSAITAAPIENAIVMSRQKYRDLWNDRTVSLIHVRAKDGVSTDNLIGRITATIAKAQRLQVWSKDDVVEYFVGQVRRAFSVQYLMECIALTLVGIGVADSLAGGVRARLRLFGMMRAVGLSRLQLFSLVALESLCIALCGLALAAVAGAALGGFWVLVEFPAILGWKIDFHFPIAFATSTGILAVVLCLVGSLIPAVRLARMTSADALRTE